MAMLKVPRVTKAQREALVLQQAEIVYDTDDGNYYGGDNYTTGGYPLGRGAGVKTEIITLTNTHISTKQITLAQSPTATESTTFLPEGGILQIYGVDYAVTGNILSWAGLGLDGFLEVGETVVISY